jgi:hypothetical protein
MFHGFARAAEVRDEECALRAFTGAVEAFEGDEVAAGRGHGYRFLGFVCDNVLLLGCESWRAGRNHIGRLGESADAAVLVLWKSEHARVKLQCFASCVLSSWSSLQSWSLVGRYVVNPGKGPTHDSVEQMLAIRVLLLASRKPCIVFDQFTGAISQQNRARLVAQRPSCQ